MEVNMFCSNCGSQQPDGTKFCSNCGATIGGATPQQQQPPQQTQQQYNAPPPQYQQQPQYQQPQYQAQPGYQPVPKKKSSAGLIILVVAVIVIIGIIWQIGGSSSVLKNVQLTTGVTQDMQPVDNVASFRQNTPTFYLTARSGSLEVGSVLTATWIYRASSENLEITEDILIDEVSVEILLDDYMLNFSLSNSGQLWPVGKYEVILSSDDKTLKTVKFKVK
jgi:hypothetical protein